MTTQRIPEDHHLPWRNTTTRTADARQPSATADLEHRARALIRDKPIVAILLAAGIGYVMARIAARGNR